MSADIWSIGIISYVLLSGIFPFNETDKKTLFREITSQEVLFPKKLWKFNSKESAFFVASKLINLTILDLLHKDPYKRMGFVDIFNYPWFYIWDNTS